MNCVGFLYWSSGEAGGRIQKTFILHENADNTRTDDVTTYEGGEILIGGMVGDWESQKLYWTNTGKLICH